jgi:hypothetical protein
MGNAVSRCSSEPLGLGGIVFVRASLIDAPRLNRRVLFLRALWGVGCIRGTTRDGVPPQARGSRYSAPRVDTKAQRPTAQPPSTAPRRLASPEDSPHEKASGSPHPLHTVQFKKHHLLCW